MATEYEKAEDMFPLDVQIALAERRLRDLRRRAEQEKAKERARKEPCPDGFKWIGQSFATCDDCGLPAWEHAGMNRPVDGPFSLKSRLEPWKLDEAERIRRKWDPSFREAARG